MSAVARYGRATILAVAVARFGLLMFAGQTYARGDYYATCKEHRTALADSQRV